MTYRLRGAERMLKQNGEKESMGRTAFVREGMVKSARGWKSDAGK